VKTRGSAPIVVVLDAAAQSIRNNFNESTQLGPLVDEAQFNRVMGFVERGQKGQGKLHVGGSRVGDKVSRRCSYLLNRQ
jgi:acyl-CoA reductase-like NAD-dependent aldehyde dehydrogenase